MKPPSPIPVAIKNNRLIFSFFLVSVFMVFVWSYISPLNRFIWYLDAATPIIAIILLLFTYHRFPFTPLAYVLIWAMAIILLVGAHYTYPLVPPFNWLRDALQLNRNHFDRLVHLGQGFVPAIAVREILLRKTPLLPGRMLFFLVISVCLAAGAFLEIIEWWAALYIGSASDIFLGTQGDNWDTQWDMLCCLIGAIASQLLLVKIHNRQLRQFADAILRLKLQEKS